MVVNSHWSQFSRLGIRSVLTLVLVLVSWAPSLGWAQSELDSPPNPDSSQASISVDPTLSANPSQSDSSWANRTASPDSYRGQATFTANPFPRAPQAPSSILLPETPTEDLFTAESSGNELRSEQLNGSDAQENQKTLSLRRRLDGSQATGTQATTNPRRQDQSLEGFQQFQTPQRSFQPLTAAPTQGFDRRAQIENASGTGDSTEFGNLADARNQGSSSFASTPPSFNPSNTLRSIPTVSDKPGQWRDAGPAVDESMQVRVAQSQSNSGLIQPGANAPMQPPMGSGGGAMSQNSSLQYNNRQLSNIQTSILEPQREPLQHDNSVRPIGFNQPLQSLPQSTAGSTELVKTLIERYALDYVIGGIPGQPVKMVEMLRQPISIQQRKPMVTQYWMTYFDWANLVSAKQHQQWLVRIPPMPSVTENVILDAAKSAAADKVLAAEIQLGKSQSQLTQYMPSRRSELLPLPSDYPLIDKYTMHYETYKKRGMLPKRLAGIDQMVPKTLELIRHRAGTAKAAKSAADHAVQGIANRQATLAMTLEAGRIWRLAEQDLVASIVDYNQAIGDYSLSIPQSYKSAEQVAGMLIAKRKAVSVAQVFPTQPSTRPQVSMPVTNQGFRGQSNPSGQQSKAANLLDNLPSLGGQSGGLNTQRAGSPPTTSQFNLNKPGRLDGGSSTNNSFTVPAVQPGSSFNTSPNTGFNGGNRP